MASDNNKTITRTTSKELRPPVLSLKRKKEAEVQNRNILASFNGNLGEASEAHQVIPPDYGSKFRDPTGITNLYHHHEDKETIMELIQKGSQ